VLLCHGFPSLSSLFERMYVGPGRLKYEPSTAAEPFVDPMPRHAPASPDRGTWAAASRPATISCCDDRLRSAGPKAYSLTTVIISGARKGALTPNSVLAPALLHRCAACADWHLCAAWQTTANGMMGSTASTHSHLSSPTGAPCTAKAPPLGHALLFGGMSGLTHEVRTQCHACTCP